MSKSLGNGIDPLEIIEKYGTDALRFSLILGISAGNDIRYMPEKLDQASNFANKIWNAAKFITMNCVADEEVIKYHEDNYDRTTHTWKENSLNIEDKWIISKLNKLIGEVSNNIDNYDLGIALQKIYDFIWNEFCDWYIEMVKDRLYSENHEEKVKVCYVLDYVFGIAMKLLHPFMPFITTKIDKSLVRYNDKELMVSKWPKQKENLGYEKEEEIVEKLKEIIVGIRNIRNNMNIHPSKKSKLIFVTEKYANEIKQSEAFLKKLGFATEIEIENRRENIPEDSTSVVADGIEAIIPFGDLVDKEEERKRLQEEIKKLEAEVARCEKMLSNPGFVSKAPQAKIDEEKAKLAKYQEMLNVAKAKM